ncbi:cation diffusion facilitator family transporter [Synechococcus sp. PCC 7502]|uniref:cation diffusion facilitator family transporter n=1 Tax=Synechococcus sp. PCC 7502 TaxID=1173263 RepID=UPI00029FCDBC|nr:cation diffusion facilitator family transporter [Synechococcus sp. PCC 7502]AFY73586.1 cation diffusion facilitator family transporter [Synechococcus sp. PCC 7502]
MTHSHSHDRSHTPKNFSRAFAVSIALNTGFVIVEVSYGILANSLALIADAGHNLSDVLGLLLAWGASLLVRRLPTPRRTFGLKRSSILAALLNASFLLIVSGGVAWEAIQRLREPSAVAGGTVIIVALVGTLINSISAAMFFVGRKGDLNIRGAFLHLAADALVSIGVVLSGIVIIFTGWQWIDPVMSLVVIAVIASGTWQLFRESGNLILDAVPEAINPLVVSSYFEQLQGVTRVHHLHIWAMSTTEICLTVNLVMPDGHPGDRFLEEVRHELHDRFDIVHPTIQIELGDSAHLHHPVSDRAV